MAVSTQRPVSREFALTWFERHWEPWVQKLPSHQAARAVSVSGATCGSPLKASLVKKIETALPAFIGWGRSYRNGLETSKACEDLRAHIGTAMDDAIRGRR